MRTQSVDTNLDAELALIGMLRRASPSKRFKLACTLTQSTIMLNMQGLRLLYPDADETEVADHFLSTVYGRDLCALTRAVLEWRERRKLQPVNLLDVMIPVCDRLGQLGIPYYLAGSLASSIYGMQQMAQDVDLVVDLCDRHAAPLVSLLEHDYAIDRQAVKEALLCGSSFSMIHLNSLMKVDIILPKRSAFDVHMKQFVGTYMLDDQYSPFRVASVYEMILFKLHRYTQNLRSRRDGMVDDAQWNDILGMLKVQGFTLDVPLLERWARILGITDMFSQALIDAGLRDG